MKTFDDKVQLVASAFYNRYEESGEPEILQKIFTNHDMSGPISLALVSGEISLNDDSQAKEWIEATYDVLTAVFDFPDDGSETEPEVDKKPKSKKAASSNEEGSPA